MVDPQKYISGERLRSRLQKLGSIGMTEVGLMRFSYTPEHAKALSLLASYMKEAGLTTRIDAVGNLFGRLEGEIPELPVILTGSHVDAVPNGGIFDGAFGIIAALECMQGIHDAGWRPKRSIEVVAFAEEEPTLFGVGCVGSRFVADPDFFAKLDSFLDEKGQTLKQLLNHWSVKPDTSWEVRRPTGGIHAFLEAHIEQGPNLEELEISLGIVSSIVGISRITVDLCGESNHAGTTPMERREDALVAAADIISWVDKAARKTAGKVVATVGKLDISPGASNVIPGKVRVYIEMRSPDEDMFAKFYDDLEVHAGEIEKQKGVTVSVNQSKTDWPVPLAKELIQYLTDSASELEIHHQVMPSWAGHDAKLLAKIAPVGMIFIPSKDGISHSPKERVNYEDVTRATEVLYKTLVKLASK